MPMTTIKHMKPYENIQPFGECSATGSECEPVTPWDWTTTANVECGPDNELVLTGSSTLQCKRGGVISVSHQHPWQMYVFPSTEGCRSIVLMI